MKKLFGAKKKEEPKPPAPTLTDTSSKLGERGKVIQSKVDECNKELMNIKNQMKTAKGMSYKSLQQKALAVLRRRKMYDVQLGNLMNQQFNIDQVQFTSETITNTIETFAALKEATTVQQQEMKKLNMDQMEDLFDDLADMMADQQEIQEVMSRSYQVEYDESELMNELNELDEEIINEQLGAGLNQLIFNSQAKCKKLDQTRYIPKYNFVNVPSYVPVSQQSTGAIKAPVSEEDQLKNLMQI